MEGINLSTLRKITAYRFTGSLEQAQELSAKILRKEFERDCGLSLERSKTIMQFRGDGTVADFKIQFTNDAGGNYDSIIVSAGQWVLFTWLPRVEIKENHTFINGWGDWTVETNTTTLSQILNSKGELI